MQLLSFILGPRVAPPAYSGAGSGRARLVADLAKRPGQGRAHAAWRCIGAPNKCLSAGEAASGGKAHFS